MLGSIPGGISLQVGVKQEKLYGETNFEIRSYYHRCGINAQSCQKRHFLAYCELR